MSDATTYRCPFCRASSAGDATSCPTCGAPVDITLRTTTSGWTEIPPVADMAKIQLGQSSCQISGRLVPVADFQLAAGDSAYFPHPSLLWQDPAVTVEPMSMRRAWTRLRAGLPLVMLQARGPGRIAFSHDTSGEMLAVPLQPGAAVDVREHTMVVATGGVDYDWIDSGVWFTTSGRGGQDQASGVKLLKMGLDAVGMATGDDAGADRDNEIEWHYPLGQYLDRFSAGTAPGAGLIQVGGNAFMRVLAAGEQILVKPPALLFKDPSVGMQLHVEFPSAGIKLWRSWGNRYLWLRLWGPGRVALQSCYDRLEDPGTDFREACQYTQQMW
ncbi:MAG TPA: AIM24 family protein [Acidimicrobiales bacterium]